MSRYLERQIYYAFRRPPILPAVNTNTNCIPRRQELYLTREQSCASLCTHDILMRIY